VRAALIARAAGMLGLVTFPFWVWALFFSYDYHIANDYIVVLIVAAAGLVFILSMTRFDATLREIMLSGLLLKFAAGSTYIYFVYRVYNANAGLPAYHSHGYLLAFDYTAFGRWPLLDPLVGTNFVKSSVAMLYILFGPSLPGAASIYLTSAFVGQYLLYRAFCIAYPLGDKRTAL
jgi:hypothetical protein